MRQLFFLLFSCHLLLSSSLFSSEKENAFIVCDNGLEMFEWDIDALRQATEFVEISACLFGGEIARRLLSEIEARITKVPNLQVYILTTPILLEEDDKRMIDRLLTKYPHNFHLEHASSIVLLWPDISGVDNHIKMFVVDEKYFSVGGTNLDESQCSVGTFTPSRENKKTSIVTQGLPAAMRDQDIVGRGTFAKQLRETFYKAYSIWENYNKTGILEKNPEKFKDNPHFKPLSADPVVQRFELSDRKKEINDSNIKLVLGGPYQNQNAITAEYVRLIDSAKEEIDIANLYFCPVEPIFKALLRAVNRGVHLKVITNGLTDIAPDYSQFFCWANRMSYVPMFYGDTFHFWDVWSVANKAVKNTEISEYYVKNVLLHKKMMLIDGKKAVVGSYNLGTRSDMGDYELIVVIDSAEITGDLKDVFNKDLTFSRRVTPEEARSWYFDPVKSYLGEVQKLFHGLL
ncbi:MAG: Cardiolipin synthase [Chlamydiales bacterium]|nr:Cardiolipin synthase [Chlamydiales bacterium]